MATKARRIGGDWVESTDPQTGKVYFANLKTRETSWTMPEEVKRFQEESVKKQKAAAARAAEQEKAKSSGSSKKPENAWLERTDPKSGRPYYYNPYLKQTSWTKPDDVAASATGAGDGKGAWVARIDPRTNRTYYYNQVTRMTSWVNPDEEEAATTGRSSTRTSLSTGAAASMVKRISKRLSAQPDADEEPAYQAGPAPPTNRTSARTSVRMGEIGAPKAGSRLSMADVARLKEAEAAAAGEGTSVVGLPQEEVKSPPVMDRFAKLRALRERTQKDDEPDEEEVATKQIDLEDLAANAMAEVTYDLNMNNYAEQYFKLTRKGFATKKTVHVADLLTWKGEKIKSSLHPLSDPALVHDAVLAFSNILCYMGDKPSRDPMDNALKIFKITVGAPEELLDEVYCQLYKQTNANPDATSCLRGWELMAMCAGLFPPSSKLEKYLLSYIRQTTESQPYPGVGKLAEYALLRIVKSLDLGARSEAPTKIEIAAVREISPVKIRVTLLDGRILDMEAESWTSVADMNQAVGNQLKIEDATPFSLFEINSNDEERALDDEDRVLDVISYWERERARQRRHPPEFQFVYKVRFFFDIKEDDEFAVQVAYHQAVHDVTDSRYPCSEEDAFRLAALMAQERFGDFIDDDSDHFGDELQAFLPAKYYHETIEVNLKDEIRKIWALLKGYDSQEAMCNYLDYVRSWKMYGSAFYFVEPQQRDFPPDAVLAVNAKGILLIDPETRDIISDWPYSEIVTWGHSSITFVLVAGNLIRSQKYYFKCSVGSEINTLVHAYVNRLADE
ncbi:Unconventional myosin-VIIa [Hondaea fermentalgiana]|uniref:Unconventional myosin-VIIa n=1 Tax=Hondaea fermentalgiana TaxID=2315210 RepID=A0A2R5G8S4_9STRA|nr:Unconventional myosin-VIIa [Hondaea fermentalgiana]|eukprot:GBG27452.1 Unconventional myosin-VIIa [Hondaea fermentalgiana]